MRRAHNELDETVKRQTEDLRDSNRALREEADERRSAALQVEALLRRVIVTQEQERQRISRDLHDTIGQQVTALRLKVEALRAAFGGQPILGEQLGELAGMVRRLDEDLDFLAWELRLADIEQTGLAAALETYIREWSHLSGVAADFQELGMTGTRLRQEAEVNLYRIAQEALNNTLKYAGARSVAVTLSRQGEWVALVIEDDGKGFDLGEVEAIPGGKRLGLVSMRERAALLGGAVEIESQPGRGTTVIARVPIAPAHQSAAEAFNTFPGE